MFGKRLVNGLTVEVGPTEIAFKLDVICCLSYSCDDLYRKLTAIYFYILAVGKTLFQRFFVNLLSLWTSHQIINSNINAIFVEMV